MWPRQSPHEAVPEETQAVRPALSHGPSPPPQQDDALGRYSTVLELPRLQNHEPNEPLIFISGSASGIYVTVTENGGNSLSMPCAGRSRDIMLNGASWVP